LKLGTLKRGPEIGYKAGNWFQWSACMDCGKQRWINTGSPAPRCYPCAVKNGLRPRTGQNIPCSGCGQIVYRRPSEIRETNYCSKQCYDRNQRTGTPLFCKVCGTEYYRPPSLIKWRGSNFCSRKCQGIFTGKKQTGCNNCWWKGGVSPLNHRIRSGGKFAAWRKLVFGRDNYTCQKCGERSCSGGAVFLHPHHIKSFTHYPDLRFEVANGITLCIICHRKEHRASKN